MSGLFSFDPNEALREVEAARPAAPAPITAAASSSSPKMPPEWQHGLDLLGEMKPPSYARPERWAQLLTDTTRFAWWHHEEAIRAGWTLGNVFGFDPDQPEGLLGLIFDLRGGRVIRITPDEVTIRDREGYRIHHKQVPDDARPIWRLRERG